MIRLLSRLAPLVLTLFAAPAHADERSFMLTGFDRIRIEGPFDVEVTTGGSAAARAVGDRRAIDAVSIEANGTTLVISPGVNGWGGYPGAAPPTPRITVTVPMLRAVVVSGGARLSVDRMKGQRIDVSLAGSGTIRIAQVDADQLYASLVGSGALTLAGQVHEAHVQSNGAGSIDAGKLNIGALTISAQSAGDSIFTVRTTAAVNALGNGSVHIGGGASCTVRGTGRVMCGDQPAAQ